MLSMPCFGIAGAYISGITHETGEHGEENFIFLPLKKIDEEIIERHHRKHEPLSYFLRIQTASK